MVLIQEDLLLLDAELAEAAYKKALALGAEVGDFGQRLLKGERDAMHYLGLGREFRQVPAEACTEPGSALLHPSNRDVYRGFRFLGLKDLVPLRQKPGDRTEVDVRQLVTDRDQLLPMITPTADLQAFSPTGKAYLGPAKQREERRLYEHYHWYIAEQVFCRRQHPSGEGSGLSRLVIIYANGPEQATSEAVDDGSQWMRGSDREFSGLRQLSLITDELQDGCELRSSIIGIPIKQLPIYIRNQKDLTAFVLSD